MRIEKAQFGQLDQIMAIYALARDFMAARGNAGQWKEGYPQKALILKDIESARLYVCIDDEDDILAVFYFFVGEDLTYNNIYDGQWLCDREYGVVHRIASSGKKARIASVCLEWCYLQCANIRIDTHQNNHTMQRVLEGLGYSHCGQIICSDGTMRLAYQKC